MVMGEMKRAAPPGTEVHHIYGRIGRLAACRYFCINLGVPEGGVNHHDLPPQILKDLRDANREDRRRMIEANEHNRNVTKCWWTDCHHHYFETCDLAEEPPK